MSPAIAAFTCPEFLDIDSKNSFAFVQQSESGK
jgi:hypothetical protein